MNFVYTVRYFSREYKQVVMTFKTKKEAVNKAKYLANQFEYNVAVCKELCNGECVEMTMYWAR